MTAAAPRSAPPTLYLEQLALDELAPESARALAEEFGAERLEAERARLLADSVQLAGRLEALAPRFKAPLSRNGTRAQASPRRPLAPGLALAAGALVAVAAGMLALRPDAGSGPTSQAGPSLAEPPSPGPSEAAAEPTRVKGLSPQVLCFRRRGEVVEALADGDTARRGDLLQLGYVTAGRAHGVLLSIDGRGNVSQHFPAPGSSDTRLSPDAESLLDRAYELDDAPDFERFILVTSATTLDLAQVMAAATTLARQAERAREQPLALPQGLEQQSLLLRKARP